MPDKLIGAASAAKRFFGKRAEGYDERRSGRPHWAIEHAAVYAMLVGFPEGASVLDMPVGTGRYAPIYKTLGLMAIGIDASEDMLTVAKQKIDALGFTMDLIRGDALDLPIADETFDAVVCSRLVNWFLPSEMKLAVVEMVRVMKTRLIITVEFGARKQESGNNPHDPKLFAEALHTAGAVEERRIEIEKNYFMIQAGRA